MLCIQYICASNEIAVLRGEAIVALLAYHKAEDVIPDGPALCNDARQHPADKIVVPDVEPHTVRPRNYGKYGVRL